MVFKLNKFRKTALILITLVCSCSTHAKTHRKYVEERNSINNLGSVAAINYFQTSLTQHQSEYFILDKFDGTLMRFSRHGDLLEMSKVITFEGDELEQGGSGAYRYAGLKDKTHYGYAESDQSARPLLKGQLKIKPQTPIYVLPKESSKHRFRIWNNQLIYNSYQVFRNRPEMNYSERSKEIRTSKIQTDMTDLFSQTYVKALQDEKATLMVIFDLDNDEYNMLAELAFGILAPETNFGSSIKYKIKQSLPIVVSTAKGNGFDTSQNSRGPTQIKNIPEAIIEHYGIEKHQLGDPRNAAIATLGFVAVQLREMRNMAHYMRVITEENLQDYMYYLYNGRRFEIRDQTAIPDQNTNIQLIKEAINYIHIEDLN